MTDDRTPPVIENAPGIAWRMRRHGQWTLLWRARQDLVERGYKPKNVWLWAGKEPDDLERMWISERCNALQNDMLTWSAGGIKPAGKLFDGSTIAFLAHSYQTDPDSPYRKVRFRTRQNYDKLLKRIVREYGDTRLEDINARVVKRWHAAWTKGGQYIAMPHLLVTMVRTIVGFGTTFLEDKECERLAGILHAMRFEMGKPRQERLTAEQAVAIRARAHQIGRPSIALAQAFQFECMLRQKDVIGEWVPQSEPGISDVTMGNEKWLRGIRWSEIDENMILRHTTSKRLKDIEVNLRLAPMIMEEFALLGELPRSGPIIVSEVAKRPYQPQEFRRAWRKMARAIGIPDQVYNMDSRAGAISEATDAGAELEHVRHAATHSDIGMTQRYSRGSVEKVANVMTKRTEHRNKK